MLERAPNPGPVGAGLLLQPTGIAVLERLGVLDEVRAGAARIERVVGTTVDGRRFMDLAYADAHGLGVHRGALFSALRGAAERAGATLLPGVEVVRRQDRTLIDAGGARYGPYGRLVGADGARSTMRRFLGVRARIHEHRWGALWGVLPDPSDTFGATLDQYFDGARRMAGFLPTGAGESHRGAADPRPRAFRCSGRSGSTASTRCALRASTRSGPICARWRRWRSRSWRV